MDTSEEILYFDTGGQRVKLLSTCICALLPAVILEIVQQASFLMLSLELLSKCNKLGRALQLRITYNAKKNHYITFSNSIIIYQVSIEKIMSMTEVWIPGARFLKVPKSFQTRKAITKISNLKFTELFFSKILNMNKSSLHAKFHAYILLLFQDKDS